MEKSKDRLEILKKIEDFERQGIFDLDVEDDPPTRTLMPNEVDYLQKKLSTKIKSKFSYSLARKFMNKLIKNKQLIIENIVGLDNFKNLQSGAIITCNHFNAFDSFAMQIAYDRSKHKKRKMFKIVREGNYTNFPGFYGMLFRNCNTLPLSSNLETMKNFMNAVNFHLKKGNFILVYPEQSMWWNYRKPKPLKDGAFRFAVKNNVPILPCFITMKDSDIIGEDGFNIQKYTIHIFEPIYKDNNLTDKENIENLKNINYNLWKDCYENTYNEKLTYLCDNNKN